MFIFVGISPLALGFIAAGVVLGLRAPWWAVPLTVVVSFALAVTAALRIMRAAERRGTMATAHWPVQQQLRAEAIPQVSKGTAPPPIVNNYGPQLHVYGPGGEQAAARVLRSLLPGDAGKPAITEE